MIKKLKLTLADLQVNTFTVPSENQQAGTVGAHDGDSETTCWGDSSVCTQNPANTECIASHQYCSAAEPCWMTNPQYGNYGCG
jgi:hypothetical protein